MDGAERVPRETLSRKAAGPPDTRKHVTSSRYIQPTQHLPHQSAPDIALESEMIRRPCGAAASKVVVGGYLPSCNVLSGIVARNLRRSNLSSTAGYGGTTTSSAPPAATAAAGSKNKLDQWLEAWNEHSGTHEISKLKELVHNSSLKFDNQQHLVANARTAVDVALSAWETSQIKHTQLMQVRDKWTPAQALEFAKLLEKEVQVRSNLEMAKKDLAEKEVHQAKLQIDYMNNLRKRYHEEQIWTDKWRILSTYGTWGLIGINTIVFLISQYLWRVRERNRMKEFEMLLKETLVSNISTMEAIRGQQQHQSEVVGEQRIVGESQNATTLDYQRSKEGQLNEEQPPTTVEKEEEGNIMAVGEEDDGNEQNNKPSDCSSESESNQREPSKQPALLSTLKSKLAKLDRATVVKQTSQLLTSSWVSIRHRATTAAKIDCSVEKLDLPSAALGACVTSVAWLVVMSLSRKGGQ